MNLRQGTKVWVQDRDSAWIPAEVLESSGKQVRVATPSGKKVREGSVLFLRNLSMLRLQMAVDNSNDECCCRFLLFRRMCFRGMRMKMSTEESKI